MSTRNELDYITLEGQCETMFLQEKLQSNLHIPTKQLLEKIENHRNSQQSALRKIIEDVIGSTKMISDALACNITPCAQLIHYLALMKELINWPVGNEETEKNTLIKRFINTIRQLLCETKFVEELYKDPEYIELWKQSMSKQNNTIKYLSYGVFGLFTIGASFVLGFVTASVVNKK